MSEKEKKEIAELEEIIKNWKKHKKIIKKTNKI
jgi:hypothetical protein